MAQLGPLQGYRVLELGSTVAGPYCGRLLADFGAEVVKVETPDGDPVRSLGDTLDGKSLYWASLSRNKRVTSINMRTTEGRDLVRQLVPSCDVVVENFRPGTLEKWGLGFDELTKLRPGVILVRVSGFGQSGPNSHRPGFGIVCEALSSLRSVFGDPDRPPSRAAVPLTDYLTGVYAALGTVLALHHRERTGQGQCVDAALCESAFSVMEGFIPAFDKLGSVPQRAGSRLPGHAPNDLFPTADSSFIHIAAGNTTVFRRLADAMGRPELKDDPRFAEATARNASCEALMEIITAWTMTHTFRELDETLSKHDVPAAPIYTVADVFQDPHMRSRDMLLEVPSDDFGSVTVAGVVPKLSATPGAVRWAGRPLGADTREVLTELLGLDAATIDRLEQQDVIRCGAHNDHQP